MPKMPNDGDSMELKKKKKKSQEDSVKVIQVNLGRSKISNDEVRRETTTRSFDITLVQEPYGWKGRMTGMGLSIGVVMRGTPSEPVGVATLTVNRELTYTKIANLCASHCDCTHILGIFGEPYTVSIYCQFREGIEKYLRQLHAVLKSLKGKRILIAMDANAKSSLWGKPGTKRDKRGEKLKEFILHNNLTVINRDCPLTTCKSGRGDTDIDVTLVTADLEP